MHLQNTLFKKIFSILILFGILLFPNLSLVFSDDLENSEENENLEKKSYVSANTNFSNLDINSRSCIVIDRLSQTTLYGKNEKNRVKMASTTKIMTAIIVLENCPKNKIIKISKKAASTGGSRLGLNPGDKISVLDLLYGLLLCSGNDAAVALAETVSGNIENFSKLMNKKAKSLELFNTHFESPHGLDSDEHYTTAYELALLSNYALENKTFLNIVGTKSYIITINGKQKKISNTNELLGNLNGIYGIKTGFTNGANRCLVTACKRGSLDIICVVLGADTKNFRTTDSIKLIEYCFKTYEYFDVKEFISSYINHWKNENKNYFCIEKGISNHLELKIDSNIEKKSFIPIKKELIPKIEIKSVIPHHLSAPIKQNDSIGNLKIFSGNDIISDFNLLSNTNIRKKNILDYLYEFLKLPRSFMLLGN